MSQDLINSILMAGLPVFAISLVLNYWAWQAGIEKEEPKPGEEVIPELEPEGPKTKSKSGDFIGNKWVEFGGGYYGVMALVTYLHVEILEIADAISDYGTVREFIQSVNAGFFVDLIISAFTNFITAFMWFQYWPKIIDMVKPFNWLLVSYVAYISAAFLVRHYMEMKANKSG